MTIATLVALKYFGDPLPGSRNIPFRLDRSGPTPGTPLKLRRKRTRSSTRRCSKGWQRLTSATGAGTTPLASPYYADLQGLPPLLVQVGTAEVLLDDSLRLADRAKEAGVDVTLEVWDDMPHVWQAFAIFPSRGKGSPRPLRSIRPETTLSERPVSSMTP